MKSTFKRPLAWIAPSRFGYLLDHLGIKKVAVVTLSHGGPSTLLLAVLHPERVSSLTLI